jgi:hypothetical protein
MIPQLNKITHTKKVAALSIVIVVFLSVEWSGVRESELATLAWKAKVIPFYERRNTVIIQQTIRLVYVVWQGR